MKSEEDMSSIGIKGVQQCSRYPLFRPPLALIQMMLEEVRDKVPTGVPRKWIDHFVVPVPNAAVLQVLVPNTVAY
jgi:hypothetical protein